MSVPPQARAVIRAGFLSQSWDGSVVPARNHPKCKWDEISCGRKCVKAWDHYCKDGKVKKFGKATHRFNHDEFGLKILSPDGAIVVEFGVHDQ
jgi:hypothetical protein